MKRHLLTLAAILIATLAAGQNVSDLIISEVMPLPDSTSVMDGYGRRTGWVELYNTSTGTVNFGGCYLSDDPDNLRKSLIPKSDASTKLGPRQCVILYCSGNSIEGTYYAGFVLEPGKTVYLVSNDGRTVIDTFAIPADIPEGQSVCKEPADIRGRQFITVPGFLPPTPAAAGWVGNTVAKADEMAEKDPHGFILSIVSVSVVFGALALLWFLFWLLFDRKKTSTPKSRKAAAVPDGEIAAAVALALDMEQDGDIYAAVAAAVHLYLTESVHDVESGIITIRKAPSSAWNDKSLNFRKLPR